MRKRSLLSRCPTYVPAFQMQDYPASLQFYRRMTAHRHLSKYILFTDEGWGAQYSSLRHCATIFEVPGSIPGKYRENFQVTYTFRMYIWFHLS